MCVLAKTKFNIWQAVTLVTVCGVLGIGCGAVWRPAKTAIPRRAKRLLRSPQKAGRLQTELVRLAGNGLSLLFAHKQNEFP